MSFYNKYCILFVLLAESTVDREESSESKDIEGEVDEEEFNWEIEQLPFTDDIALGDVKYGFGNLRSGVFKRLQVCIVSFFCPN